MFLQIISLQLGHLILLLVSAIIFALAFAVVVLFNKYVALVEQMNLGLSSIYKSIEKLNGELEDLKLEIRMLSNLKSRER